MWVALFLFWIAGPVDDAAFNAHVRAAAAAQDLEVAQREFEAALVLAPDETRRGIVLLMLAEIHAKRGSVAEACARFDAAIPLLEKARGPAASLRLRAWLGYGDLLHGERRYAATRWYEMWLAAIAADPARDRVTELRVRRRVAWMLRDGRELRRAEEILQRAVELSRELHGADAGTTLWTESELAEVHRYLGETDRALRAQRGILDRATQAGIEDANVAYLHNRLALLFEKKGDVAQALTHYTLALELRRRLLPSGAAPTSRSLLNLALFHADTTKDRGAAVSMLEQVIEIERKSERASLLIEALNSLANLYVDSDLDAAERVQREAVRVAQEHPDELGWSDRADAHMALMSILGRKAEFDEMPRWTRAYLDVMRIAPKPARLRVAEQFAATAAELRAQGDRVSKFTASHLESMARRLRELPEK